MTYMGTTLICPPPPAQRKEKGENILCSAWGGPPEDPLRPERGTAWAFERPLAPWAGREGGVTEHRLAPGARAKAWRTPGHMQSGRTVR